MDRFVSMCVPGVRLPVLEQGYLYGNNNFTGVPKESLLHVRYVLDLE